MQLCKDAGDLVLCLAEAFNLDIQLELGIVHITIDAQALAYALPNQATALGLHRLGIKLRLPRIEKLDIVRISDRNAESTTLLLICIECTSKATH